MENQKEKNYSYIFCWQGAQLPKQWGLKVYGIVVRKVIFPG